MSVPNNTRPGIMQPICVFTKIEILNCLPRSFPTRRDAPCCTDRNCWAWYSDLSMPARLLWFFDRQWACPISGEWGSLVSYGDELLLQGGSHPSDPLQHHQGKSCFVIPRSSHAEKGNRLFPWERVWCHMYDNASNICSYGYKQHMLARRETATSYS